MVDINLSREEMVKTMRQCAEGECNDTCPYCKVPHDCSAQLLRDAADMIEEG